MIITAIFIAIVKPSFVNAQNYIEPEIMTGSEQEQSYIFSGITWGNGLYLAVGDNGSFNTPEGYIFTSADGITWTKRASQTSSHLNDVAFSNDLFVAVGENGTVVTSPDGLTWTPQDSGFTKHLNAVTWTGNKFYAVGEGYSTLSSTNGLDWTIHKESGQEHYGYYDVAWNGTRYVVVGSLRQVHHSFDGINWSDANTDLEWNGFLKGLAWDGIQFVGVGGDGSGEGVIYNSATGLSWHKQAEGTTIPVTMNKVAWGNNKFIAVGNGGYIATAPSNMNWNVQTPEMTGTTKNLHNIYWGGHPGHQIYVAVGRNVILTSSNGITWTERTPTFPTTGFLQVTIEPEDARSDGAQWSIDDGDNWHNSGSELELEAGTYTITFKEIDGWVKPINRQVLVEVEKTTYWTGTYTIPQLLMVFYTNNYWYGDGVEYGETSGGGWYDPGAQVTAVATAYEGNEFLYWRPADINIVEIVHTEAEYSFIATESRDLRAMFRALDGPYPYEREVTGGTATLLVLPEGEYSDPRRAAAGTTVTIHIFDIESGKSFKSLTVQGLDQSIIPLIEVTEGGEYTFTMPSQVVMITIELQSEGEPSNDAELSNLTTSIGQLSPSFNPSINYYSVDVDHDVATIDLTATLSDGNASMSINGIPAESEEPETIILEPAGSATFIDIDVTAEDGMTSNIYTITVNRAESPTKDRWRNLTTTDAQVLAYDGGILAASVEGFGIGLYDGNDWINLTTATAQALATDGSTLVASVEGFGTWAYDGGWSQLTPFSADLLAVDNGMISASFADHGIWLYDGNAWANLTPAPARALAFDGGRLVASVDGFGTWIYDGNWEQLTAETAQHLAISGGNIAASFAGLGIWYFDGHTWHNLTTVPARSLALSNGVLAASVDGFGTWLNDGEWSNILAAPADLLALDDGKVAASFAGQGIWLYE